MRKASLRWSPASEEDWRTLCQRSGHGLCAFQGLDWQRVLTAGGYEVARLKLTAGGGDEVLAGFCAVRGGRFPFHRMVMPLLTPYQGFVVPSGMDGGVVREGWSRLRNEGITDHVALPPEQWDRWGDLSGATWRQTCHLSLEGGRDGIMSRLHPHAFRHLKKILKNPDYTIGGNLAGRGVGIAEAFEIFKQPWTRKGLTCPVSRGFFRAVWANEPESPLIRNWLACHKEKPVALVVTVQDSQTLYYAVAACDSAHLSSGIATALVVETAVAGANAGLKKYDLVGANTPGITEFKLGLGAKIAPFSCVSSFPGLRGKMLRLCRSSWRWIVGK